MFSPEAAQRLFEREGGLGGEQAKPVIRSDKLSCHHRLPQGAQPSTVTTRGDNALVVWCRASDLNLELAAR
jgi:hypothetical protein